MRQNKMYIGLHWETGHRSILRVERIEENMFDYCDREWYNLTIDNQVAGEGEEVSSGALKRACGWCKQVRNTNESHPRGMLRKVRKTQAATYLSQTENSDAQNTRSSVETLVVKQVVPRGSVLKVGRFFSS